MKNRTVRLVLSALVMLLIAAAIAFVIYVQPLRATETARMALSSTNTVRVTDSSDQIAFMPSGTPKAGFVFYPGAKVEPVAYSQSMKAIAEAGYAVFVVKFPFNFAIISPNRADAVIAANPTIQRWALGGHSLGGATACLYAKNSSKIQVLVFWAAYCDKRFDVSARRDLRITSLIGSLDGLASPSSFEAAKAYAPASTKYIVIEGGNHAQFGDYGQQPGDVPATITPEAQRQEAVTATIEALETIPK